MVGVPDGSLIGLHHLDSTASGWLTVIHHSDRGVQYAAHNYRMP
jgi:hypothetical protein